MNTIYENFTNYCKYEETWTLQTLYSKNIMERED